MVASSGATARIDLISDPNQQTSVSESIMQRLDPQSIARKQQTFVARVIDRKGEHAAQLLDAIAAHLFVEMDYHFCVGVRMKAMTAAFEIPAKLGEVVNLSVIDNADGFVFVEDWLVTTRQVDDAEPPHP